MTNSLNNIKSTVNSKLTITSTFLNNVNVKSAIGINEYERVIPPLFELNVASENEKEDNFDEEFHKIKCLEIYEVEEVVDLTPDTKMRDKAIIKTLLHTGLRVSELVALNKNDIQVALDQKGCFILPENYHKAIPVYVKKSTTKGKRHARITYMDYDTLRLLNKMIRERITKRKIKNNKVRYITQRKKANIEKTRTELFTNKEGNRISIRSVQLLMKKYAEIADEVLIESNDPRIVNGKYFTEKFHPHGLRHTFLSHAVNDVNLPLIFAKDIAGHQNISTTERYIVPSQAKNMRNYQKMFMKN